MGELKIIHVSELLAGDIVNIYGGMEVPGDGLVFVGNEIKIDESAITGENDHVVKMSYELCLQRRNIILKGNNNGNFDEFPSCILLSGTKIISGSGKFLVLTVGQRSIVRQLQKLAEPNDEKPPMQEKLERLANDLTRWGIYLTLMIFAMFMLRFFWQRFTSNDWDLRSHVREVIEYILVSVTFNFNLEYINFLNSYPLLYLLCLMDCQ